MEVGYCQYHCMAIADAVFHYRLYDLLRIFLKKFCHFQNKNLPYIGSTIKFKQSLLWTDENTS